MRHKPKKFYTYRVECLTHEGGRGGDRWRVCWYLRASSTEWAERKAFPNGKPGGYRVVFVR